MVDRFCCWYYTEADPKSSFSKGVENTLRLVPSLLIYLLKDAIPCTFDKSLFKFGRTCFDSAFSIRALSTARIPMRRLLFLKLWCSRPTLGKSVMLMV